MDFLLKSKKIKKATIDFELLEDLKKQKRIALIWMHQQPNIDLKIINH